MSAADWNDRYANRETPWDTGVPDPHLVELVESGALAPGRALELGCGTGTNALWLAARGFEVTGLDLASRAIAAAVEKRAAAGASATFHVHDILEADAPGGPYDLVFDRGMLHVFDGAEERERVAERVERSLRPGGRWLSLAGSTEGPARDHGPPRRSARDLVDAIEPRLEILSLRKGEFAADLPSPAAMWILLARRREIPAQPSSRREARR